MLVQHDCKLSSELQKFYGELAQFSAKQANFELGQERLQQRQHALEQEASQGKARAQHTQEQASGALKLAHTLEQNKLCLQRYEVERDATAHLLARVQETADHAASEIQRLELFIDRYTPLLIV